MLGEVVVLCILYSALSPFLVLIECPIEGLETITKEEIAET